MGREKASDGACGALCVVDCAEAGEGKVVDVVVTLDVVGMVTAVAMVDGIEEYVCDE